MSAAPVEQGWPVLRQTMCRVGMHIWVWTGPEDEPLTNARCDCEALCWSERPGAADDPE